MTLHCTLLLNMVHEHFENEGGDIPGPVRSADVNNDACGSGSLVVHPLFCSELSDILHK